MSQEKDQLSLIHENEINQSTPVNTTNDKLDTSNVPQQSNDSILYDNMIFPS